MKVTEFIQHIENLVFIDGKKPGDKYEGVNEWSVNLDKDEKFDSNDLVILESVIKVNIEASNQEIESIKWVGRFDLIPVSVINHVVDILIDIESDSFFHTYHEEGKNDEGVYDIYKSKEQTVSMICYNETYGCRIEFIVSKPDSEYEEIFSKVVDKRAATRWALGRGILSKEKLEELEKIMYTGNWEGYHHEGFYCLTPWVQDDTMRRLEEDADE